MAISFESFDLKDELKEELRKLNINYVFQPVFKNDLKTIHSYEALLRPEDMSVKELIDKYIEEDKLHVLEIATLFGAIYTFKERGYQTKISINSFPTEKVEDEEMYALYKAFGDSLAKDTIVEILEYPHADQSIWDKKRAVIKKWHTNIAVDDYGSGENGQRLVDFYNPESVKIDKSLITNVSNDINKQERMIKLIERFHGRNMKIIAEGVETKEDCLWLVSHGVDFLQGFYLGRPE